MTTKKSIPIKSDGNGTISTKINFSLFHRFYKSAPGIKALITLMIVLFLFITTHILKFPGSVGYLNDILKGQKTFDLSPSFTFSETYLRLQAFGQAGRTFYMRTMLTVDLVFPLSMFLFLYFFSKHVSEKLKIRPGIALVLTTLPVLYLLLDFIENVGIFILLFTYPDKIELIGSTIGFLTVGKRIFMTAAIFVPLILLVTTKIWSQFHQNHVLNSQGFDARA